MPPPQERRLFLRRCLAHPQRVAALMPSSRTLAEMVARRVPDPGGRFVLEVGAGTGPITRALAERIPQEQLILVEIDEHLCAWLRSKFPRATVLCGDVTELSRVIAARTKPGEIASAVSGVPVTRFSRAMQQAFLDQCFDVLSEDGALYQYSYSPVPPMPCRALGVRGERIGLTWASLPPIFLWRFSKPNGAAPPIGQMTG
jgi:phosphatidylethanolamine/phosphatidyl-N-methylethanolamine N-methyltransferase